VKFSIKKRVSPSLNITPLIDVVLLLLIFFMISTTFVAQPGINVNLPKTVSSEKRVGEEMIVTMTKDRSIYLNEKKTDEKYLLEKLKAEYDKNNNVLLVIKADKEVSHGRVVEVMDLAKQAGISRQAIATVPKELQ
jgi:biopolymer transport protein ExbD